tara:strand:- start:1636 stop:2691 length:1056 start_codon:yes stop_codon:yes gene_type:complete
MALVFPKAKPIGVNSSSSQEAIRGSAAFPTKVIDYLKFDIFDQKTNTLVDGTSSIYLYLPTTLSESHRQNWEAVNLGPAGNAALEAAKSAGLGGDGPVDFGSDETAAAISKAAAGAVPQVGYTAASKVINTALSATGQGGNLDTAALTSLVGKKIFNPYAQAVYKGQSGFRTHSWTWQLIPKSADDASTIYNIVQLFRKFSLPGKGTENWLTIPEYFRAQIVRYTDKGGGDETIDNPGTGGKGGILSAIMQFPTKMVLKNMTVDMPNYTSLRSTMNGSQDVDFGALQYNLTLEFSETAFLTKETYGPAVNASGGQSNEQIESNNAQSAADWLQKMEDMIGDFGPFTSGSIG